ncbi:MAG: hypothetical protein Q8O13_06170 [Candidatus Omnitrophota bacterium]|nr:hypothetical protein [Candidatus Omnitrophota bacterium]
MIEIIFLIILILISAGLGKKIYQIVKINFTNFWEEFVFSSGLGWAVLSYLTLALYLLNLLDRICFYGLISLIIIFIFPQIIRIALILIQKIETFFNTKKSLFTYSLLAILLVQVIFSLFGALAPPTDWDGLAFHLMQPKSYLAHINLTYNFLPSFLTFPKNAEMLYLLGMGLKSDILAKLINFAMGIMLAISIFSFSRKYFSFNVCLLASTIFYTMPIVGGYLSTMAFVDLFVYFYEFLAIYAFFNWWDTSKKFWLVIAGIMIGFSMGVKYLSIVSFSLIVLGIIIKVLFIDKKNLNFLFSQLLVFIPLAVLIPSYWYIRNFISTGNPFWPIFYRIFGGLHLTPEYLKYMEYALLKYGIKRTLINYLLLPWYLTFNPDKFGGSYLNPLFFVFLPVLLFFKEKKRIIIHLLFFSGLYLTVWFWFLSQQQRFLPAIITLLSICTAYAIERVIAFDIKFKKVIYIIIFSWFLISTINIILDHKDKIPVILGMQTTKSYLSKKLNFYQDIDFINHNLPKDSNILLIDFECCYYLERKFTYGDLGHQTHILYKNYDVDSLMMYLKELGITHIFIPKDFCNRKVFIEKKWSIKLLEELTKDYKPLIELLNDEAIRDKYLELIHSRIFNLYKIR